MKLEKLFFSIGLFSLLFVFTQCENDDFTQDDVSIQVTELSAKGGKPDDGETAGNNLSFPVIWADGVAKVVPGTMEQFSLNGDWWGILTEEDPIDPADSDANDFSCITPNEACDDALYRAYEQKDALNTWQASNWAAPINTKINVDFIDWGDNLESIDWSLTSQVRVEMVLLENTSTYPGDNLKQFAMRYISGWGTNEAHGLQTALELDEITGLPIPKYGLGDQATVYSPNARFTIQKLNVDARTDERLNSLVWVPEVGWVEPEGYPSDLISNPIYNTNAGAEINVKGKIIYGFTWGVRRLNEGAGLYRITFSFDPNDNLNTFFDEDTEIIVAVEEEVTTEAEDGDKGGEGKMDLDNNLTYMDILIAGKTTGSGGGGGRN